MQALKDDVDFVKEHWLDTEPRMPPPNDNSRWHGIKLLGSGSYGAAGLWAEADAANNIRDRMVIKEAKAFTPSRWRDPKNWRDRLPQEIRIHQLLEERRADGKPTDEDIFVPEGFVWYTIKALATACLVLREGTIDDTPVDGWRPITHLDLQLPNILLNVYTPRIPEAKGKSKAGSSKSARLNRADADDWRAREPPVMPVLADFGISFFSPDRGDCPITDNPDDYVIHETDTRYPPIKDKDGLQLILPDTPEFAIGQPVDAAKRRGRE
ncbi:hypothetical protein J4E83_000826 [Alternaria metachromatica]|uniref:uncharacterized protein n=1 Tax=Alternaria metachromatica TaxID=283354 RepID=UPI0020C31F56|nr:uncharacterized protein J4E83_000826 [Alternaria metachromatica]KAI4635872.1 hypothetical protein J4E83_000826 [Alternaria metachromatica]